jgi:hypothetical protein
MDFSDQISQLASRVEKLKPQLLTELTTRNRGFIEVSSNIFHSSVATLS